MLSVNGLSLIYNEKVTPTLKSISFNVMENEWLSIVGASGSGKSTLINTIINKLPLNTQINGEILFHNTNIRSYSNEELFSHIGVVFQNPSIQLLSLTVLEELTLSYTLNKHKKKVCKITVEEIIEMMNIHHLVNRRIYELSEGQKQIIAIASALLKNIELLLLDEPTSYLDDYNTSQIIELLKQLKSLFQFSIIMVEHKIDALKLTDKTLLIDNGEIIKIDSPDNILKDDNLCFKYGIKPNPDDFIKTPDIESKIDILTCNNLSFSYNRKHYILEDFFLDLFQGESLAIFGKNGSGKTTLAKLLCNFIKPTKGKIVYSINKNKSKPKRSQVFMVFSNPQYQFLCDNVFQEIELINKNLKLYKKHSNFKMFVEEVITAFGLNDFINEKILSLSYGQQQRLLLAIAAIIQPKVLVLDEPSLGQNWKHISVFFNYLSEIKKNGMSIVFISHCQELINIYSNNRIIL